MSDLKAIVAAAKRLREAREPFLVATVVQVIGSSYRRPGARLIATNERRIAGSVSGGCLEGELVRTGWWRTRNGPEVVRFDSSDADDPGAPLGCGGVVDILLERANEPGAPDPLLPIEQLFEQRRRGGSATIFAAGGSGLAVGTRWCVDEHGVPVGAEVPRKQGDFSRFVADAAGAIGAPRASVKQHDDGASVLVEPVDPPVHLFVFGTGLDAVPVVEHGRRLGWDVTVWDGLGRFGIRDRFLAADHVVESLDELRVRIDACDRAMAVVMGHDLRRDGRALEMLVASRVRYIGVLGPRHRLDRLDSGAIRDPRVRSPVGLDLGAETPEEIALAVVAEVLATVSRASMEPLSSRSHLHEAA